MANEKVQFRRGLAASIPSKKIPGTLLVETDTGNVYLDDTYSSRVQLTDTGKISKAGDTMTGDLGFSTGHTALVPAPTSNNHAANKEYVDKATKVSGAASTVISDNLAANRAVVSNGSGKLAESATTSTEIGYLSGVTSNIQTQLNNKAGTRTATTAANGLMSSTDKSKLDGIAEGANKTTVDSTLSSTSTNPVQNKAVYTALQGKASTSVATTTANGLMSSSDKSKLNGLKNITVDSSMSANSTNPVQNKVVKTYIDDMVVDDGALD